MNQFEHEYKIRLHDKESVDKIVENILAIDPESCVDTFKHTPYIVWHTNAAEETYTEIIQSLEEAGSITFEGECEEKYAIEERTDPASQNYKPVLAAVAFAFVLSMGYMMCSCPQDAYSKQEKRQHPLECFVDAVHRMEGNHGSVR